MRSTSGMAVAATLLLAAAPAVAQDVKGSQLQIVEGVAGVDPETGFVHIRGEIWNRTKGWIVRPRVMVDLFDAAGKPLGVSGFLAETKKELGQDDRDSVVAQRVFVPPGEAAPFEYVRDPAKIGGRYASHKLEAAAWAMPGAGPKATVEGLESAKDGDGAWMVSGTIKVGAGPACRSPKAVLAFYSADGKVALATYEEPESTFQKTVASGQSVPFGRSGITSPAGSATASVKAWGDCSEPD